jgi:hypothetical protein
MVATILIETIPFASATYSSSQSVGYAGIGLALTFEQSRLAAEARQ